MDLDLIKEKLKTYCAYQERCTKDVKEKLVELNVPSEYHTELIAYLNEYDFLNDKRFLQAYINGKINLKRWGEQKIIWHLQNKGFSKTEILTVLSEIPPGKFKQNAIELARYKLDNKKLTYDVKGKIYRYLYNKGYSSGLIYEVINNLNQAE